MPINRIYEDIQIAPNDYFFAWMLGAVAAASLLHKVMEPLLSLLSAQDRKMDIY